jgi:hypothetical protein
VVTPELFAERRIVLDAIESGKLTARGRLHLLQDEVSSSGGASLVGVADQFGSRFVSKLKPAMVCTAAHQHIRNKRVRNCGMLDITEDFGCSPFVQATRSAILRR